jgi:threonine/homoserine/homoserine lactone efflux protein
MPDPALFAAFVAAVAVLMLIPGPNVALIVANSLAYGPRYGLLTVAGTSAAMIPQLLLTSLGMTQVLGSFGSAFEWLRWVGVAYLVYLGVAQWRAPATDLTRIQAERKSARAIFARALLVSLTNPKTLFFFGAFFPQFIAPNRDAATQVEVLAVAFLMVAMLIDAGWALLAARARVLLRSHGRLRNRVSGGFLVGAGAALALARTK